MKPYLEFSLALNDGGSALNKDFTVLLDLEPGGVLQSAQIRAPSGFEGKSKGFSVSGLVNDERIRDDLMGPYDYAQAGNIPAKFGAVLDGQSLWRVARRINDAMGVSRSQMIWALYQANPNAFSANSVQSLKAGSFLTIPRESVVKQVSHEQAKANLNALSGIGQTKVVISTSAVGTSEPAEFSESGQVADTTAASANDEVQASPFQVTSVGEQRGGAASESSEQVQEIIVSLTETVGSLSRQLIRKDGQIESLEAQVEELKSFISDDANLALASGEVATDSDVDSGDGSPKQITGIGAQNLVAESSEVDSEIIVSTPLVENSSTEVKEARPIWHWVLLAVATLLIGALVLRTRVAKL